MKSPQFILPLAHELFVDLFAGGGGASTGIEAAISRHVDIAINHDPAAISLHETNHRQTRHYISDVFEVDPLMATCGQPVGGLWLSPDCKHFSKAKGGTPVSKHIRGLAWIAIKWVKALKPTNRHPRVIWLENVEEFLTWGPLGEDNRPCPQRKGETFQRWLGELHALGYTVEWRELRACDYGAPTIRRRLFLIARRDGLPIVWPEATHAKRDAQGKVPKGLRPWRTAAECIDWSIPCPSIFERSKPLADSTCRRIAKGLVRYVIDAEQPFIVSIANLSPESERDTDQPLSTMTAFLAKHYTGAIGSDLRDPLATVTSVDHHSLVTAHLIHMGHGEGKDGGKRFSHGVRSVDEPLNTITASGAAAGLITSQLVKLHGDKGGGSVSGLHHDEVRAFQGKYYRAGGQDRLGLATVTIAGEDYVVVDIGLRMLTPAELYRAQGFPETYKFQSGADGRPLTKTAQIRMCGNSVSPPAAEALVRANFNEFASQRIAA